MRTDSQRTTSVAIDFELVMTTVYIYETILLLGLAFFVFNYFSGKGANRKIAQRWVSANLEQFQNQFTVVSAFDSRLD